MEYLSYIGWQFQLGPSFDRIYNTFGAYRRKPQGTIALALLGFDPRLKHEKLQHAAHEHPPSETELETEAPHKTADQPQFSCCFF
jgi:hypothetical protein